MEMSKEVNLKDLIEKAKKGDSQAFSFIYEKCFTPIYRYLYIRMKNKEEAEDLTQVIFIKILKSVSKYRNLGKNPWAYFFSITRNALTDHWRKKKNVITAEPVENFINLRDEKKDSLDLFEESERAELIKKAIGKLDESHREIIILKFINGLSNKEIAKLLNKNEDAVRQSQCRALRKLKEHLK